MTELDWHTDDFPELRAGPPWVMQEMMASQPELTAAILSAGDPAAAAIADAARTAAGAGRPVIVTGCGTSEHAAHGIAALLAAALPAAERPSVRALPALSATLDPQPGLCIAVSHDGGTRATLLALEAAARAGAETAAITAKPAGSIPQAAEHVLVTPRADRSWCHTVGYTSAISAGAAVAARLGLAGVTPGAAADALAGGLGASGAEAIAQRLTERRVILCAGLGPDLTSARELALKIAEGAQLPALALELETVLHGQLAGHDGRDALVLVALAGHADHERHLHRAAQVASAAMAIGLDVAALVSEAGDPLLAAELTPAGRVTVPVSGGLEPTLAALLGGAGALQALTLALVHTRETNPDLIRREQAPYRAAAAAAEGSDPW
jgi:glucosamine--fructose-6-phosphate aminotransferase (isomerizing)